MMNTNHFPEDVNFYPVMAIQAARRDSRVGGGWRLFVLAKALDRSGRGAVSRDALREYVLSLGASARQWQRWIIEARNNDLLRDVQRKSGEWDLILPGPGMAGSSMKCATVGIRKVSMKASLLIGTGWKARIWAAYEATHNGKPISRETMQKIVNVPVSTQRYRDAQAGVKRQRNYAKLKAKADALPILKEYSRHKGLYVRSDGFIGSRKPDSRSTDLAFRGGKGRTRKANKILRQIEQRQDGLSLVRQALSDDVAQSNFIRLFNFTPNQTRATAKKLANADNPRVREVYEYAHEAKSGASIWCQC